ncbi:tetratricopeptide repeat protein [Myxococcus hansupus]|uniref:tetratricopeptide repeat protein n=1 Tax=Pseudomyxococcus hansupus TaxID=1297742 RepID=UPI001D055C7A|nr:tetratricopeptide repeat protein [Myxococcus hansupus]
MTNRHAALSDADKRRISKRIDAFFSEQQWDALDQLISESLQGTSDDHWLHVRRADAWYARGKYAKAARLFQKVLESVPRCPLGRWGLANALMARGDTNEARKLFLSLARQKPEVMGTRECGEGVRWARGLVADAHFRLGQLEEQAGAKAAARRRYQSYLRTLELPAFTLESRKAATARLRALSLRGQSRD